LERAVKSVNIHEAKTNLSKLVEEAAKGEPFIIAKAGKPMVKVVAVDAPEHREIRPIGFLEREFREGRFKVPDDFDRMDEEYIAKLFEGEIE
jgi:prevent-host-death family protein